MECYYLKYRKDGKNSIVTRVGRPGLSGTSFRVFRCPKTRIIGFIFGQAYSVVVAQNILHLGARDEHKAQRSRMV